MDLIISICVLLSYTFGAAAILENKYRPSIYSRIIWLLFAVNNFASVIALKNNQAILLIAGLGLMGNLLIFLLSLKKSQKTFGQAELVSSVLLLVSLAVWVFANLPFLNLTIGLTAHFIGGIPTYHKVIQKPQDEDLLFWFFFFLASALALFKVDWTYLSNYLYPLYFALFDGGMTLLCLRGFKTR